MKILAHLIFRTKTTEDVKNTFAWTIERWVAFFFVTNIYKNIIDFFNNRILFSRIVL